MDSNLGRTPTKRWQEAKSYTYDGDDWGGYDDYAEYPAPSPPQSQEPSSAKPSGLRRRGQSLSSSGDNGNVYHDAPSVPSQPPIREASGPPQIHRQPLPLPSIQDNPHLTETGQKHGHSPGTSVASRVADIDRGAVSAPQQPLHGRAGSGGEVTSPSGRQVVARAPARTSYVEDSYQPPAQTKPYDDNIASRNIVSPPVVFPPRDSSLQSAGLPTSIDPPQALGSTSYPAVSSNTEASTPDASEDSGSSRSFIRPADIYKRMEQEKEKERRSGESGRPSLDTPERPTRHTPEPSRSRGTSGSPLRHVMNRSSPETGEDVHRRTIDEDSFDQRAPFSSRNNPVHNVVQSAPSLPKLDRFSGFGPDLWGMPASNIREGPYVPGRREEDIPTTSAQVLQAQSQGSTQQFSAQTDEKPYHGGLSALPNVTRSYVGSQRSTTQSEVSAVGTERSLADISPIMKGVPGSFNENPLRQTVESYAQQLPLRTTNASAQPATAKPSDYQTRITPKEPVSPSTSSKHHADLGSAQQSNSPARSPAFEKNQRIPQPAIAELGVTTPGGAEDEEYGFPDKPARANDSPTDEIHQALNFTSKEADAKRIANTSSEPPAVAAARRAPADFTQGNIDTDSAPISAHRNLPPLSTTRSSERSPSPSKSRVRDLASRYNEYGEARSPTSSIASWASSNPRSASPEKELVQDIDNIGLVHKNNQPLQHLPNRAALNTDTGFSDESNFRPKLPGEWISYSTPAASVGAYQDRRGQDTAERTDLGDPNRSSLAPISVEVPQSLDEPQSDRLEVAAKDAHIPAREVEKEDEIRDVHNKHEFEPTNVRPQQSISVQDVSTTPPVQVTADRNHAVQASSSETGHLRPPIPTVQSPANEDDTMEDLESDRLSKEIMRSLTPAGSSDLHEVHDKREIGQSERATDVLVVGQPFASAMPSQSTDVPETQRLPSQQPFPESLVKNQTQSSGAHPVGSRQRDVEQVNMQPGLSDHRFSWEHNEDAQQLGLSPNFSNSSPVHIGMSPSTITASPKVDYTPSTPLPPNTSVQKDDSLGGAESSSAPEPEAFNSRNVSGSSSKPIELPAMTDSPPTQTMPEVRPAPFTTISQNPVSFSSNIVPARTRELATTTRARSESKLLGFQDILALKNPSERIRTYRSTRDQFAVMHTGLDDWMGYMIKTRPEYAQMGADSSAAAAVHPPQASTARLRQTSQPHAAKEREVSQSASSKATNSVKGFLAKGRNKFRAASSEKGLPTSRSPDRHRLSSPSRPRSRSLLAGLASPESRGIDVAPVKQVSESENTFEVDDSRVQSGAAATNTTNLVMLSNDDFTDAKLRSVEPSASRTTAKQYLNQDKRRSLESIEPESSSRQSLDPSELDMSRGRILRDSWTSGVLLWSDEDEDAPPIPWRHPRNVDTLSRSSTSSSSDASVSVDHERKPNKAHDNPASLKRREVGTYGARGFGLWEEDTGIAPATPTNMVNKTALAALTGSPAAPQAVFPENDRALSDNPHSVSYALPEKEVYANNATQKLDQVLYKPEAANPSDSDLHPAVRHDGKTALNTGKSSDYTARTSMDAPELHHHEAVREFPRGVTRPVSPLGENLHQRVPGLYRPVSPEAWSSVRTQPPSSPWQSLNAAIPQHASRQNDIGIDGRIAYELASEPHTPSQTGSHAVILPSTAVTSGSHHDARQAAGAAQLLHELDVANHAPSGKYSAVSTTPQTNAKFSEVVPPGEAPRKTDVSKRFSDIGFRLEKIGGHGKPRSRFSFIRSRSESRAEAKRQSQLIPDDKQSSRQKQPEVPNTALPTELASPQDRPRSQTRPAQPSAGHDMQKPQTLQNRESGGPRNNRRRDSFFGGLFRRTGSWDAKPSTTSPRKSSNSASWRLSQNLQPHQSHSSTLPADPASTAPQHNMAKHRRTPSAGLNQHPITEFDLQSRDASTADFPNFPVPPTGSPRSTERVSQFSTGVSHETSAPKPASGRLEHKTGKRDLQSFAVSQQQPQPLDGGAAYHATSQHQGPAIANADTNNTTPTAATDGEEMPLPQVPPKSPARSPSLSHPSVHTAVAPPPKGPISTMNAHNKFGPRMNLDTKNLPPLPNSSEVGLGVPHGVAELEDEPVVMSPTSWPGQEWVPKGVET